MPVMQLGGYGIPMEALAMRYGREADARRNAADMASMFIQDRGNKRETDAGLMMALMQMLMSQQSMSEQGRQFNERMSTEREHWSSQLDLLREQNTAQIEAIRDSLEANKSARKEHNEDRGATRVTGVIGRLGEQLRSMLGSWTQMTKLERDLANTEVADKAGVHVRPILDAMTDLPESLNAHEGDKLSSYVDQVMSTVDSAVQAGATPAEKSRIAASLRPKVAEAISAVKQKEVNGYPWYFGGKPMAKFGAWFYGDPLISDEISREMVQALRAKDTSLAEISSTKYDIRDAMADLRRQGAAAEVIASAENKAAEEAMRMLSGADNPNPFELSSAAARLFNSEATQGIRNVFAKNYSTVERPVATTRPVDFGAFTNLEDAGLPNWLR